MNELEALKSVAQAIRHAAYTLRLASRYNDDAENRGVYRGNAEELEEALETLRAIIGRKGE